MCPDSYAHEPTRRARVLQKGSSFTPEDDAQIRAHCTSPSGVTRVAKALGRYRSSVLRRALALGLSPKSDSDSPAQGRLTVWEPWEDAIILSHLRAERFAARKDIANRSKDA